MMIWTLICWNLNNIFVVDDTRLLFAVWWFNRPIELNDSFYTEIKTWYFRNSSVYIYQSPISKAGAQGDSPYTALSLQWLDYPRQRRMGISSLLFDKYRKQLLRRYQGRFEKLILQSQFLLLLFFSSSPPPPLLLLPLLCSLHAVVLCHILPSRIDSPCYLLLS